MDDFKKVMERLVVLGGASENLYSQKLEERAAARHNFDALLGEAGLPRPNYEDAITVGEYRNRLAELERERIKGYLYRNLDDVLGEVPNENFADGAELTRPVETGSRRHDKAAKIHQRLINYGSLQEAAKRNYSAVANQIAALVEKDIEERLRSTEKNPSNRYLNEKAIKKFAKWAAEQVIRSRKVGRYMLARLAQEAKEEFESALASKSERANYARENIISYSTKGEKELIEAAGVIYHIGRGVKEAEEEKQSFEKAA